jgi:hypothetical protein
MVLELLKTRTSIRLQAAVVLVGWLAATGSARADPAVTLVDAESAGMEGYVTEFRLLNAAGTRAVFAAPKPGHSFDVRYLWRLDAGASAAQIGDYAYDVYNDFAPPTVDPNASALAATTDARFIIAGQSRMSATAIDVQTGAAVRLKHSGSYPAAGSSFLFPGKSALMAADAPGAPLHPVRVLLRGREGGLPKRIFGRLGLGGNAAGATGLCHGNFGGDNGRDDVLAIATDVSKPIAFHAAPGVNDRCILSADGRALTSTAAPRRGGRLHIQTVQLKAGAIRRVPVTTKRAYDDQADLMNVSPGGRYVLLGHIEDYRPDQRARFLVDTATKRVRKISGAFAPMAWSPDERTLVGSRDGRVWAIDATTGRGRRLADAKTLLPGSFRDRTNGGRNPPFYKAFTRDSRAVVVQVSASSSSDSSLDYRFGVRLPLDGSAGALLPRSGEDSFEDLVYSADGARAFLITTGPAPVRAISTADADAGSWSY